MKQILGTHRSIIHQSIIQHLLIGKVYRSAELLLIQQTRLLPSTDGYCQPLYRPLKFIIVDGLQM